MFPESDLQSLETSGNGAVDTLNRVVQWLHEEGLYATENALLAEIESKYPDRSSSHPSRQDDNATDTIVDLSARTGRSSVADSHDSIERFVPPSFYAFPLSLSLSLSDERRVRFEFVSSLALGIVRVRYILLCDPSLSSLSRPFIGILD